MILFAQIEHSVTGWEVALAFVVGFPGLVAAILGYLNQTRIAVAQNSIEEGSRKTDTVHSLFNSRLDEWKAEIAKQNEESIARHEKAVVDAVTLVKTQAEASAAAAAAVFEKRIAAIESAAQIKEMARVIASGVTAPDNVSSAAALAAAVAAPAALAAASEAPAALLAAKPDASAERLEEIRGQQK